MSSRARAITLFIGITLTSAALGCGDRERSPDGGEASVAPGAFRPLAVGAQLPVYKIATLSGDTVSLGGREPVTILNIWATWCTSCKEEMADLETLSRELADRGVRVVGISVDASSPLRVRSFVERERITFAVAHDPEQRIQQLYQIAGVPETLVIDGEGRLLWRWVGNIHPVVDSVRRVVSSEVMTR